MCKVEFVSFLEKESEIRRIRDEVFVKEQGFSYEIEYDGKDEEALHLLLYVQNEAIGTGRVLKDGKIGRIAILKEFRKKGFGEKIVESFLKQTKKQGFKRVYLSAQIHATNFYTRFGFKSFGNEFYEGEIPHIQMEKLF